MKAELQSVAMDLGLGVTCAAKKNKLTFAL